MKGRKKDPVSGTGVGARSSKPLGAPCCGNCEAQPWALKRLGVRPSTKPDWSSILIALSIMVGEACYGANRSLPVSGLWSTAP